MKLKITWKRSTIGRVVKQEATIEALGLKRLHHSVIHEVTPQIQGMVNRVRHLVDIEEIE